MKINWKRDKHRIGVYLIRNTVNQKVYIGQSKNIAVRIAGHISALRRKSPKEENEHFISEFTLFGKEVFEYEILEDFDEEDRILMKNRELYWCEFYNSTDVTKGYNLRLDSSDGMLTHDLTRERIGKAVKGEKNPNYGNKWTLEQRAAASVLKKEHYHTRPHLQEIAKDNAIRGYERKMQLWKNDPSLKEAMKDNLSKSRVKYKIRQEKRDGALVKVWDTMRQLLLENPEYKRHNIYAVISGEKPTMYGYKWVKIEKNNESIS